MNAQVDTYLDEGCGRCPLGGTPDCKAPKWKPELIQLRRLLLEAGLTEEIKWGQPTYLHNGKNVLIMSAFKEHASLNFFQGALIKDPEGLLEKPGENTQAGRVARFTSVKQIADKEETLRGYIQQAILIEEAGLKFAAKAKDNIEIPEELQAQFDKLPALQTAFEGLTPGRQRGYIIYFTGAKQSQTRTSRIEKYIDKILEGRGFHDR